jgi:hypothetical protein
MKNLNEQAKESKHIKSLFDQLISSDHHLFPSRGKINITEKHGVYIIYSPQNIVLHVGNTPSGRKGLNQRLYNHISKTGVFYREYLKAKNISLRGKYKFKYIEVENARHRALLEAFTAGNLCPVHFGTAEKKKENEL